MKKVKKQSGFTLVEIAIVLVIIGLLLAGVLKGQELIESSRVKSMAKDLSSFSVMMTSYQDRYRAMPGDDSIATSTYTDRGWGTTAFTAVTSNGLIGAPTAITTAASLLALAATTENVMAIQALRYAGFLEGDGSKATPPINAAGGSIGFTHTVMGADWAGVNVVCFTGLNGKQAGALDRLLDDGVNSTGSVRAVVTTVAATVPTTASYVEATPGFILCKTL